MDSTVVNTLITGIFSLAVCYLSAELGRRSERAPHLVRKQQLEQLYAPLDKLFITQVPPEKLVADAHQLLLDNYTIVPPTIWKGLQSILKLESIDNSALQDFRKLVATHYEWTRKSLGYPYNGSRIVRSLTPVYRKNQTRLSIFIGVYYLSWGLSVILFGEIFAGRLYVSSLAAQIITLYFLFGAYTLLARIPRAFERLLDYLKK